MIDADKLKKHYAWWNNEEKKVFDDIVDLQPTVDAVKVVRCKDCIYRDHSICYKHSAEVSEDDFCSRGERKDDVPDTNVGETEVKDE